MANKKRSDLFFYIVIFYVLAAGGWWSYLLYIKNDDALKAKKVILWYQMQGQGATEAQYLQSDAYLNLVAQYDRQQRMIMGEGVVLLLFMIIGIWKIAQSRKRELELAEQQRNFLLSITHELKSPIASIQLVLETFRKRELKLEQTKKLANNGLVDTARLHKLVQDMLLAARMEGGYQYSFEPIVMQELLSECIKLVQPRYKGEMTLHAPQESILKEVDKMMITSAVLNLLENAVKYAGNTEQIDVYLNDKKDKIEIQIFDQGVGIPKLERGKIFSKFYRVGSEETRRTKGTGLGLYIVKEVIDAHKGDISVKGNQPQGSVFSISLPKN
ncbi:MAG: HAMP domain-containing histidine kinase [Aureispira sp.]|nr:HAMP domain-containing histidine kinase [Aureispira sp.]